MDQKKFCADAFEANRPHLKAIACRILGSASEAEDALQEAWLRLDRADVAALHNIGGWLTTVVSRICLDILRSRKRRGEEPLEEGDGEAALHTADIAAFERDAMLADSVGLAMLVVLRQLKPAERIAFVLHDMFDMSFEAISDIVGRSAEATRQLASRARRRVQGKPAPDETELAANRSVVAAFLTASRTGDMAGLLAVLDPDVTIFADEDAMKLGAIPSGTRGADAVARAFSGRARQAEVGLIDDAAGVIIAPAGVLRLVLEVVIRGGRIVEIGTIANPDTLAGMELTVLQ